MTISFNRSRHLWRNMVCALALLGITIYPISPLYAQNASNISNQDNDLITQSDILKYRQAFIAARSGNRVSTENLIAQIENKSLKPYIDRELLLNEATPQNDKILLWLSENIGISGTVAMMNKARSLNIETPSWNNITLNRRNFNRISLPREVADEHGPNVSNADYQFLNRLKAAFEANNDDAVLNNVEAVINGPLGGRAAWYGGLSAYRKGYFQIAYNLFSITANWQYGDDNTKAQGAYWAARSAAKLSLNSNELNMLEQAANYPLSFYGQLALARLGRWQNLQIPNSGRENINLRQLIDNNYKVQSAMILSIIGENEDAKYELSRAWAASNSQYDIAFATIARAMNYDELVTRISENSSNLDLARHFPIIENITPQGGEFVLDRALIFAVMRQESRFNERAVSYAGARGLMQLMPSTAAWMTGRSELRTNPNLLNDVSLNLTLGEGYLERVMSMNVIDNNLARTLMAYNAGPGNVSAWSRRISMSDDTLFFIEATPVTQTREYVKNVLCNLWIYHKRLGQNAPSLMRLANENIPYYEPQDNPRMANNNALNNDSAALLYNR